MEFSRVTVICLALFSIDKVKTASVDILMNDFNYEIHRENYLSFFNIKEQNKNNRKSLLIEAEFVKPVNAFDAQVALSRYTGHSTFPLLNVSVNGCRSLDPKVKNRVFKIIAHAVHYGESEFPKKCPMAAKKRYVIDQFYLHPEDFAFLQPDLRVLANFSWVMEKKRIFSINMDFSTKKK